MNSMTGGCLCGAIRFELAAAPAFQFACHCEACQHASGGSPTLGMVVPAAGVTITKGEPRVFWSTGESGGKVGRCFCETCGSPLFSKLEATPEMMVIKIGALDAPSDFQVQGDMWMSTAKPWHQSHEGAVRFETNPGA